MISKKIFPIIIFIFFFQYVSERNLNYFNFQKVSKMCIYYIPKAQQSAKRKENHYHGGAHYSTGTGTRHLMSFMAPQLNSILFKLIASFSLKSVIKTLKFAYLFCSSHGFPVPVFSVCSVVWCIVLSLQVRPERTKQILTSEKMTTEGLELVIILHTQY